jgi:NADPH:quinone reductase-like Zn-dependent oxidoreductase
MAIMARENEGFLTVQAGTVLVEVERSAIDVGMLRLVSGHDVTAGDWRSLEWCSLCGRVTQVGSEVKHVKRGDRISAIGVVADRVVLPVQDGLLVPDGVEPGQATYWALVVALVRSLGALEIEIGERVLVLGGGLLGRLAAQLAWFAGATCVVGLDLDDSTEPLHESPPLMWVTEDRARTLLAQEPADVLIDVLGDWDRMNRWLLLVREGGRALSLRALGPGPAAREAGMTDFDFYPGVHRRSIKLFNGTLSSALRQRAVDVREAGFVHHLIGSRLDLDNQGTMTVRAADIQQAEPEQVLPAGTRHLVVQWKDYG